MMDLASITPMRVQALPIPHGDAGTAVTIQQMWKLIDQGKKSPLVREVAVRIVQEAHVPALNYVGEARAIFHWVLQHIRFTRDIRARETLHSADEILRLSAGDCDDCTVLVLALAQSLGAEGRITTISTLPPDENGPAEYTHVYPSVFAGGRWIALDCAREHPAFGKEPRYYTRLQDWEDPSEDTPGAEYLNFYVGRNLTMGTPASRGIQGLRGRRMGSLRSWQAGPQMTSRPEATWYSAKPRNNTPSGMSRLAQDWTSLLPSLISTGASSATELIAASKGAPTAAGPSGVSTGAAPSAYGYPFAQGYAAGSSSSLFSSPMIWVLLLGGAAVLMISRR
jgi:hypothetical protein